MDGSARGQFPAGQLPPLQYQPPPVMRQPTPDQHWLPSLQVTSDVIVDFQLVPSQQMCH